MLEQMGTAVPVADALDTASLELAVHAANWLHNTDHAIHSLHNASGRFDSCHDAICGN